MSFINKILNKKKVITIYTSKICSDCQLAKEFFKKQDLEVKYKDIAQEKNSKELARKYKRLAVPTIVIGNKVILGFEQNKDKIIELLKK